MAIIFVLKILFLKMETPKMNLGGGAINIFSNNVTIVNCEFLNNKGQIGAIYISNSASNVKINKCHFEENNACYSNSNSGMYGGAINSHCRSSKITNSDFISNKAKGGGAINIYYEGTSVDSCTFKNNHASASGGAIWMAATATEANIKNSNFINNQAENDGGAIYTLNNVNCNIYNCEFNSNNAINGGAIYSRNILYIESSKFQSNEATQKGGSIYNQNKLTITNSIFTNNKASSKLYAGLNSQHTYVNCSDDAVIKATLEGGNNIINAIWSDTSISFDSNIINPNNKLSSQQIILAIDDKIFSSTTDNNGETIFKFNTKNFKIKKYKCTVSFKNSNDYFESSHNLDLDITTKLIIKTELKKIKKIKKVKKYQAYIPSPKYIKVQYKITYINSNNFNEGSYDGYKKIKKYTYKWKNVSKKSLKNKYKWCKSRYHYITQYIATKVTYKLINGNLKKSVNKKYKFNKEGKNKNIRKKDWTKYVLPSVDCESDNKQIIKQSNKIIKNEAKRLKKQVSKLSDSQKANAILHWVQKHIKYDDYGDTRKGAVKTLKTTKGNCVDQTHLSIALLRAANIPAKYETKIIKYNGKNKGHAWHLAYFKNKWWPGESTDYKNCPKYGKSKSLTKNYIKVKSVDNMHKISYKFISKYVKYKNKWCKIYEQHLINNEWEFYLGNNWDTVSSLTKIQYTVGGNLNE